MKAVCVCGHSHAYHFATGECNAEGCDCLGFRPPPANPKEVKEPKDKAPQELPGRLPGRNNR